MSKNKKSSILKPFGAAIVTNKKGERVIRKIGMTGYRLKTDPAYTRTRENGVEFGRAAAIGAKIRHAFGPWIENLVHPGHVGKLVRVLFRIIQSDASNCRGERNIVNGDLKQLEGFVFDVNKQGCGCLIHLPCQFNPEKKTLLAGMTVFERPRGFLPGTVGATHVKIQPVIVAINPVQGKSEVLSTPECQPVKLVKPKFPSQTITAEVTIPGPIVLMVAIYIEFLAFKNNTWSQVEHGRYNSLTIRRVFHSTH